MKSKTILFVEDDAILRLLLSRVLRKLGAQVLEAPNGTKAVRLAKARDEPIDLLVTDVMMPTMDDFELADQFASTHPETRVLLVTGYADESEFVRRGLQKSGCSYLLKPFTQDALIRRVTDELSYPPCVVPIPSWPGVSKHRHRGVEEASGRFP